MELLKYSNQLTVMTEIALALKIGADTMTNDFVAWNGINGLTYCLSFKNNLVEILEEDIACFDSSNQEIYTVVGIAKIHNVKVIYNDQEI